MKEQDKEKNYEDIINLPHHVSPVHPPMPLSDRAAQFAPFAALTGYGDVIKETARQTDRKPELTEEEKQELDYKLQMAVSLPGEKPAVTITYFVPDKKKAGGSCRRVQGRIRKADTDRGILIMERGEHINLDMVVDITVSADWI